MPVGPVAVGPRRLRAALFFHRRQTVDAADEGVAAAHSGGVEAGVVERRQARLLFAEGAADVDLAVGEAVVAIDDHGHAGAGSQGSQRAISAGSGLGTIGGSASVEKAFAGIAVEVPPELVATTL